MNCISCKSNNSKDKKKIHTLLNRNVISNISEIIVDYLPLSSLEILHSLREEKHWICDKCLEKLKIRSNFCDTPFIECPGCSRILFIGYT